MKKLILVRGLPGSGKTTYAKEMAERYSAEGTTATWLETSQYFDFLHTRFTKPEQVNSADVWIKRRAEHRLTNDGVVIVANVASSVDAIDKWKDLAAKQGADFEVIRLDTHWEDKVPTFIMDSMKKIFESYPGETVIPAE